jgi:Ca2+/Na+ antiporter
MKTIGMLATVVGMVTIAAGTLIFVRSIPEIRRYLKIRNM